jgi:general secretion pathway protein M
MMDLSNLPRGLPGRVLALLLTLVAVAAAYLLVVAPLLGLYADRASQLSTREMLRDKIVAAAAALPQLRAQASELSATSDAQQATLQGSSDPIAMANLQNRVEELATSAGAAVSSTETLPPEIRDYYRRIGLRVAFNGSYESLMTFIAGLETSTTPLIVDNLQIHTIQTRAGSSQVARLDAAVDVYGFRLNDQSNGPRP